MAHLLAHLLLAEAVISIVDVLNELPLSCIFLVIAPDIETLRTIDYLFV